jgi:hypothetical protein
MIEECNFVSFLKIRQKGDQPEATRTACSRAERRRARSGAAGITGSGKTFTIANVIDQVQRPTLVLAHNKTLAAQLYQEFKTFFPRTRSSILFLTTIIISPRHTFPPPTLHRKGSDHQRRDRPAANVGDTCAL